MMSCISEPISWLRLERFAADGRGPRGARTHRGRVPACQSCLDEILRDVVISSPARRTTEATVVAPRDSRRSPSRLPRLLFISVHVKRSASAFASRASAPSSSTSFATATAPSATTGTFRTGDRFKVIVTCPPEHLARFDVAITEQGASHADRPLAPAQLLCGNRIAIPGRVLADRQQGASRVRADQRCRRRVFDATAGVTGPTSSGVAAGPTVTTVKLPRRHASAWRSPSSRTT